MSLNKSLINFESNEPSLFANKKDSFIFGANNLQEHDEYINSHRKELQFLLEKIENLKQRLDEKENNEHHHI
jgi:hypothetical protein